MTPRAPRAYRLDLNGTSEDAPFSRHPDLPAFEAAAGPRHDRVRLSRA